MKKILILLFCLTVALPVLGSQKRIILSSATVQDVIDSLAGKNKMTIYGGHQFYKDQDSAWQNINPNFETFGSDSIRVVKGQFQVKIDSAATVQFRYKGHKIGFQLDKLIYYDNATDTWAVLASANRSNRTVDGDSVYWVNYFPNVHYRIKYGSSRMDEALLVTQTARDAMPTPASQGMTPTNTWVGMVYRIDTTGLGLPLTNDSGETIDWSTVKKTFQRVKFGSEVEFGFPVEFAFQCDTCPQFPLRKAFVKVGENLFLAIGMRYNDLKGLPTGNVIFDPSVTITGITNNTDNYLSEEDPDGNFGGATDLMLDGSGVDEKRILQFFNVSSIPSDATVDSAFDSINVNFGSNAATLTFFKILVSWTEGTDPNGGAAQNGSSDWNHRQHATASWTTAGCAGSGTDIESGNMGTHVTAAATGWEKMTLTNTKVEDWVDGTSTNNGMRITIAGTNVKIINSSENASNKPRLVVYYTEAGAAAAHNARRERLLRLGD